MTVSSLGKTTIGGHAVGDGDPKRVIKLLKINKTPAFFHPGNTGGGGEIRGPGQGTIGVLAAGGEVLPAPHL